ncbi:integrase catalytic domain-containing protein [Trichonephila clavipes]|nr:integrase catalytic domain-containing protein [Trichonephila clavipes]
MKEGSIGSHRMHVRMRKPYEIERMGSLLNITPIKNTSDTNSLSKLYDRAETEVRNLESLGINSESYGNLLTPILLKVLPSDLTLEFSRKNKSDNWDLKALLEFLGEEIQSREFYQNNSDKTTSHSHKEESDDYITSVSSCQTETKSQRVLLQTASIGRCSL